MARLGWSLAPADQGGAAHARCAHAVRQVLLCKLIDMLDPNVAWDKGPAYDEEQQAPVVARNERWVVAHARVRLRAPSRSQCTCAQRARWVMAHEAGGRHAARHSVQACTRVWRTCRLTPLVRYLSRQQKEWLRNRPYFKTSDPNLSFPGTAQGAPPTQCRAC